MARTFAYVRVSTHGQTVENQIQEIKAAGFEVAKARIVSDTVSGSSTMDQRAGFMKLLDRLETGDVLVVSKMDRLGRNAIDVATTVKRLAEAGVRVHCLQLGGADLTSSAGKMIMGLLNTFAEFERDLLIERVQAGLARAVSQGKKLGRKPRVANGRRTAVIERLRAGESVAELAAEFAVSRMTIMRVRDAAGLPSPVSGEWREQHAAGIAATKRKNRRGATRVNLSIRES
jgi:putative DNA-invertase from lambdoid prophage Rac